MGWIDIKGDAIVFPCTLIIANPLPSISQEAYIDVERLPILGNMPLIILVYPPYILLCIGLALDASCAQHHPGV